MPLRSDPSLWFNLPGVVAAYQPVRAPDSLLARYNMAHGGDDRSRVVPVNNPGWSPITGWSLLGSPYFVTDISHNGPAYGPTWSAIACMMHTITGYHHIVSNGYYWRGFSLAPHQYNATNFNVSASNVSYFYSSIGVGQGDQRNRWYTCAVAGLVSYFNGRFQANLASAATPITTNLYIGYGPLGALPMTGYVKGVAIYNRTLSQAEVWHASRQMQYCDVNPDWSAWGRRRQYYFAPTTAAVVFQAAWAERANRLIGGS